MSNTTTKSRTIGLVRRLLLISIGTLLLLTIFGIQPVAAWEKQDHEIFELTDGAQELSGDPKATFYSLLGVERDATVKEIQSAYRKVSYNLHPDKNPDPKAAELYALLSPIMEILKNTESRALYDRHLRNGIPRWRGTGYFYRHYKPGTISVIFFVSLIFSGLQYMQQYLNYSRQSRVILTAQNVVNNLTFPQIKQLLKKSSKQSKLNKSDFKGDRKNYDILTADLGVELGIPPLPIKPSFFKDTIMFTIPIACYKRIRSIILKENEQSEGLVNEEELPTLERQDSTDSVVSFIRIPGMSAALREIGAGDSYPGTPDGTDFDDMNKEELEDLLAQASAMQNGGQMKRRKKKGKN